MTTIAGLDEIISCVHNVVSFAAISHLSVAEDVLFSLYIVTAVDFVITVVALNFDIILRSVSSDQDVMTFISIEILRTCQVCTLDVVVAFIAEVIAVYIFTAVVHNISV